MAVEEWLALRAQSEDPSSSPSSSSFERPLAALDLFILEQRADGDIEDVSSPIPITSHCHDYSPVPAGQL